MPLREGLSPRTRGNRVSETQTADDTGSIPANAGEPSESRELAPLPRVYPRERGGTRVAIRLASPGLGLSPRTRGNHYLVEAHPIEVGSIPANAGEPPHTVRRGE